MTNQCYTLYQKWVELKVDQWHVLHVIKQSMFIPGMQW